MALRVVFTGKGSLYHPVGRGMVQAEHLDRTEWERRAHYMGWEVQNKVNGNTDYLVASRTDTSKAKDAALLGAATIDYARFNQMYLDHDKPGGRFSGKCGSVQTRPTDAEQAAAARQAGWGTPFVPEPAPEAAQPPGWGALLTHRQTPPARLRCVLHNTLTRCGSAMNERSRSWVSICISKRG